MTKLMVKYLCNLPTENTAKDFNLNSIGHDVRKITIVMMNLPPIGKTLLHYTSQKFIIPSVIK